MLEEKRDKFKKLEYLAGKIFSRFGLTPNQYTLISLVFIIIAFYFLINSSFILTAIFFLIASALDFIDGSVARIIGKATKRGAYLETICDRYVEGIILLGFLFLPLPEFYLPASFWIFLALFGSLLTPYSKSAAKEKDLTDKEKNEGLAGRPERLILILLAIIFGLFNFNYTLYAIIVLAIISNITALQRIYLNLKSGVR